MKGENAKFLKNPRLYMRDTILQMDSVYTPTGDPIRNGDYEFDIMEYKYHRVFGTARIRTTDASKYCIIIRLADRQAALRQGNRRPITTGRYGTKRINGYYLGWNTGTCYTHQIGGKADFLFTPLLTGCTFYAAGNNLQIMTVAHLNIVGLGASPITVNRARGMLQGDERLLRSQAEVEQEIRRKQLRTKTYRYALRPADYRGTAAAQEDLVTVVGIRNPISREWAFHYQTHRNLGHGTLQLIDAARVPRER